MDDGWDALGRSIAAGRARSDEEARAQIASSMLTQLSVLFDQADEHARAAALALAPHVEAIAIEDWERCAPPGSEPLLALRDVWRILADAYEHAQLEADGDERWALLASDLREELEPLRDDLLAAIDGCADARAAIAEHALLSWWPLEPLGGARALTAQALDAITERSGIPRSAMLDPEHIADVECFADTSVVHPVGDLPGLLERRRAWAKALFALRDHLAPLR